jgi:hypothetical protein
VFERYNAEAVRALFFARKAVSDHGGTEIKPAHLIIGVLHAHPKAVLRFASANVVDDDVLQRLVAIVTEETRVPMTYEVRFSQGSKAALTHQTCSGLSRSSHFIRPCTTTDSCQRRDEPNRRCVNSPPNGPLQPASGAGAHAARSWQTRSVVASLSPPDTI